MYYVRSSYQSFSVCARSMSLSVKFSLLLYEAKPETQLPFLRIYGVVICQAATS
jgi:hypothetical protein